MNEPLPDLHVGSLTRAEVLDLARDVAALGERVEVRLKRGPRDYAPSGDAERDPQRAAGALVRGETYGLQLHYFHAGAGWSDTLLPEGRGDRFRLVRMRCAAFDGDLEHEGERDEATGDRLQHSDRVRVGVRGGGHAPA